MTAATAAITASGMMSDAIQVTVSDASQVIVSPKKMKKNGKKDFEQEFKPMAPSAPVDRFYWYNKTDVAAKPSYKTEEMYYHYFETPKECIEDLLVEMYDCALVRTEEIRYIAYGIEPRAISMKEILSSKEGANMQIKKKEPSTQDLIKIYENWCGYVEKLFGIIEFHADTYTIDEIHTLLCEFGKSDVDILITGM
ncbi:MAG: hypothetical protein Q4D54_10995 [Eubacteriales bacterium]|nr:hypothetical protein [Lachnospiraceae bacterium]MDO5128247.1 hypothetical protein [Eubacteriales bacterium]